MDLSIVALIAVQVTLVLGLAGIGSKVWLKRKELQKQADATDVLKAIDDLQAEVEELRTSQEMHVTELYERIDFAERMLTQGARHIEREKKRSTPV